MVPKISVCIPTYNSARFLPEAIDSVLAQTHTDFELIIIDNCSTDDTATIVKYYEEIDERVRFIINAENIGMVGNWNRCLEESRGEYIKFVFSDDLLLTPKALEKMLLFFELNNAISLVCSSRMVVDECGNFIKKRFNFADGVVIPGVEVINRCLVAQKNLIGEPTAVMFRQDQSRRGFSNKYKQIVDLEMWFYLLEQGGFAYIEEPLCAFRVHKNQQTSMNRQSLSALEDLFHLYNEYMYKPYINITTFTDFYIKYDNVYRVIKICIGGGFAQLKFFLLFPAYFIIKPVYKLYKKYFLHINYR